MKNIIHGVLALSIMALAFACQKDNAITATADTELISAIANASNKQAVTVAELPTDVQAYVALSFTPVEIEAAWRVQGKGYEVELEDGQDLYFRENGDCMGTGRDGGTFRCMRGDTVDVSELPQAAADYVTANYAGLSIQTVVFKTHHNHSGYAVELSDGTILLFDEAGAFVSLCGEFPGDGDGHGNGGHGDGHGGGHGDGHHNGGNGPDGPHGGCAAGDSIGVADLPQAVTDYIAANYAGETVTLAVVKPSGKFGVELSSGTVLLFDAEGVFIKVCDGQPDGGPHHHHCDSPLTALTDLPQAAQDYIAANYAGETFDHGCAKNNGNFIVELSNDVKILFDADGNVLFDSGN
ncbi:MAG: PepSY-like domain-containing protein [Saprospiraceae bacterium]|nr:PepSY-like domain-containing protein [Saprospiraceae bacterium]